MSGRWSMAVREALANWGNVEGEEIAPTKRDDLEAMQSGHRLC